MNSEMKPSVSSDNIKSWYHFSPVNQTFVSSFRPAEYVYPILLRPITSAVLLQPLDLVLPDLVSQLLDQIRQSNDGPDRNVLSEVPLGNTDSALGLCIADSLLPVQEDDNTGDGAALLLDDPDGLAQRRSGRDDVVHDDDPLPLQRGADNASALTVRLGLLAVERVADIVPRALRGRRERIPHRELIDDGRAEWNSLVRGAEEDVEVGFGGAVGGGGHEWRGREHAGVCGGRGAQEGRGVKQGGGEEVGRLATGFQDVRSEGEDVGGDEEREERRLVVLIGGGRGDGGSRHGDVIIIIKKEGLRGDSLRKKIVKERDLF